jgi:hypothetical protein
MAPPIAAPHKTSTRAGNFQGVLAQVEKRSYALRNAQEHADML